MVYNEELKRKIPAGWSVKRLGRLSTIKTGKEDANFATENGKYAFFTTAEEPLRTDTAAFDGDAILIAGNGNFFVHYYNQPFNAYQRTYVIQPTKRELIFPVYFAVLNRVYIFRRGSNGSIMKFIRLSDVEGVPILYDEKTIREFYALVSPIFAQLTNSKQEIERLVSLRDWLLPMLMNGQISID